MNPKLSFQCIAIFCLLYAEIPLGNAKGLVKRPAKKDDNDSGGAKKACKKGPPEVESQETELNGHNYWETAYGRSGATWPTRGFPECWENRGAVCTLPDEDHVVCLPGSRRGSTVNNGWALDPRSQPCRPGVFCLYACEPGYYWTQFNNEESSSFDTIHAGNKGNCDGTWQYGTSTQGVFCDDSGLIHKPKPGPLCQLGETYVFAENRLDTHIFICQTVFPGHEIFLIPTLVKPGESVLLTTHPKSFWKGPKGSRPTHADFFVSFAGADIMESCTPDEFSPSGAALLPYEIGTGVEDNGVVYSTHYFYQQPNSEVPSHRVGYELELKCTSQEDGVCGPIVHSGSVTRVDVLKKPTQDSSRVTFIFKETTAATPIQSKYSEPNVETGAAMKKTATIAPKVDSAEKSNMGSGRRLKTVVPPAAAVSVENGLQENVVLCEEGSNTNGISVRSRERVQVLSGKTYYISSDTCDNLSHPSWRFWTGIETEKGRHHGFAYNEHRVANGEEMPDYALSIKCVSEEDSCRSIDASTIEIPRSAEDDSSIRVLFVIKPFSTRSESDKSYSWAQSMLDWISSAET